MELIIPIDVLETPFYVPFYLDGHEGAGRAGAYWASFKKTLKGAWPRPENFER